jgi:uncharacterized membrane protein
MYWDHGGHVFGWFFGSLLFLVLVGFVVYALVRLVWGHPAQTQPQPPVSSVPQPSDDPLAVLRLRYARGEIGRDDFLQASRDLGAPPASTDG